MSEDQARELIRKTIKNAVDKETIDIEELKGNIGEIRLNSLAKRNIDLKDLYKAGVDKKLAGNLESVEEVQEVLKGLIRTKRMTPEQRKPYAEQAYMRICDILDIPY